MHKKIAGFMAAALLLAATDAGAQGAPSQRGVVLGVFGNLSALQLDEDGGTNAENGPGAGVMLGYGSASGLTGFIRGTYAGVTYEEEGGGDGTFALAIVELGARYGFSSGPDAKLRLYGELGLSGTALSDEAVLEGQEVDYTFAGPAILLGGGIEYDVSRSMAVDVGMALGKGRFTQLEVDGESADDFDELDFTTVRINAGIVIRL